MYMAVAFVYSQCNVSLFNEVVSDDTHGLGNFNFVGVDVNLRRLGSFVRCRDPGKVFIKPRCISQQIRDESPLTFDLPCARLFVKPLRVACLDDLERGIDKYLDER